MQVESISFFDIYKSPEVPEKPKKRKERINTSLSIDDFIEARYTGRSSGGFIHNHHYIVKLQPRTGDDSMCTVKCIEDVTTGIETDQYMHFSNSSSANKFFEAI
jgi:hypothetical protein